MASRSGTAGFGFSFWSKNEPIAPVKTDHWSKQRAKTFTRVELPNGRIITQCRPENIFLPRKDDRYVRWQDLSAESRPNEAASSTQVTVTKLKQSQTPEDGKQEHHQRPQSASNPPARRLSGFQDLVHHELGTTLPQLSRKPGPPRLRRRATSAPAHPSASLRSAYNTRARQGYRYWHEDKPKKVEYGARYTFGAKNTVIGLGKTSVI